MSKDWSTPDKNDAPSYRRGKPDGTWACAGEAAFGNRVYGPQWQGAGAKVITDEEKCRQEKQRRQ